MVLKVFIKKVCGKTHKDSGKMRERTEGCYGNALQSIERLCVLFFPSSLPAFESLLS